jgi:hypothetical protein
VIGVEAICLDLQELTYVDIEAKTLSWLLAITITGESLRPGLDQVNGKRDTGNGRISASTSVRNTAEIRWRGVSQLTEPFKACQER